MSVNNRGAVTTRRTQAKQSFQNAAECIGPITAGLSLFAVTRGQWSMIDALLHCLDSVGTAEISLWTWTVAEYEVQCMERLMLDKRIKGATLIVDYGARNKNRALLEKWQSIFGPHSVKLVVNHAKIATVTTDKVKLLLRGSMNLNFNPRFEQFDITEGGADYDLIKELESELEALPLGCAGSAVYKQSLVSDAFDQQTLDLFQGAKVWNK